MTPLQRAERCYQAGDLGGALQAVTQALHAAPNEAAPVHLAGLVAIALNDADSAERLWRHALALDPACAEAHFNLALLYARQGRGDEAENHYRAALAHAPGNAEAHCNLGNLLAARGRDAEAAAHYRAAAQGAPAWAAPHFNLGNLATKRGHHADAAAHYRAALARAPDDAAIHAKLALALTGLGMATVAETHYRAALARDPQNAEALANLALLLDARAPEEAERLLRQALAQHPATAEIHVNLGNLLARLEREDEAESHYRAALALDARNTAARCNLAVLHAAQKRAAEAEAGFRQVLAQDPAHALAGANLGYLLLAKGRWEEGWRHHEMRLAPHERPAVNAPPWQGEALAGKTLLVLAEQGFGDTLQFARYLPHYKALGAARVVLVCRAPLKALLATLPGVDAVLASETARNALPATDYWTPLLSAPYRFGTRLENIPAAPYLAAAPERRARWAARLPSAGRRVGLVWRGNARHHNDRHRSLPGLAALAALWTVAGVHFVSLQKEISAPDPALPLLELGAECADFADTAALVENLDLVISVDSAVAHLTGALGKPGWVLLPDYRTDWRWLEARADSPWYPSLRLFRQPRRGDWAPTLKEVRQALAAWAAGAPLNRESRTPG
jgi:Flp pilus assembly protein TadD